MDIANMVELVSMISHIIDGQNIADENGNCNGGKITDFVYCEDGKSIIVDVDGKSYSFGIE